VRCLILAIAADLADIHATRHQRGYTANDLNSDLSLLEYRLEQMWSQGCYKGFTAALANPYYLKASLNDDPAMVPSYIASIIQDVIDYEAQAEMARLLDAR